MFQKSHARPFNYPQLLLKFPANNFKEYIISSRKYMCGGKEERVFGLELLHAGTVKAVSDKMFIMLGG